MSKQKLSNLAKWMLKRWKENKVMGESWGDHPLLIQSPGAFDYLTNVPKQTWRLYSTHPKPAVLIKETESESELKIAFLALVDKLQIDAGGRIYCKTCHGAGSESPFSKPKSEYYGE